MPRLTRLLTLGPVTFLALTAVVLSLAIVTLSGPAPALERTSHSHSHDSHAPAGARGDWLPSDEWVMSGWLPYDEGRLEALLHVTRDDLDGWLDDRRSLGQLAARHGFHNLHALAARLVADRATDHRSTSMATLRARALDTLTQPHLARHVLFHLYHSHALPLATRQVFGVTPAGYERLRDAGSSPVRIARAGGLEPAVLRANLRAFFSERADRAVRTGAMSRAGADRLLAEQDAGMTAFMFRPYRTSTQQACYAGEAGHDHGHDSRDCHHAGMSMPM